MQHIVIIGGSDAGISAALRAREINPHVEITIVVTDCYPNFSICGQPFYLSGEVQASKTLAHRTAYEIEREGIHLLLEHTATAINPHNKQVEVFEKNGNQKNKGYDG